MSDATLERKLPVPHIKSGKCASAEGVLSDGIIDWTYVEHLWVQPMEDSSGLSVYVPCVVFLDGTWAKVGPQNDLEQARRICNRMAAIHDRGVSDGTRPALPQRFTPEEMTVDVVLPEMGDVLPGDPWAWSESDGRFRLNLAALGSDIALGLPDCGLDIEKKLTAIEEKLIEIERVFRSCGVIQPHLVAGYLDRTRAVATFWVREMADIAGDDLETPEDIGRSLADDIRKEGVTVGDALRFLARDIHVFYRDLRWDDDTPVQDREQQAEKAMLAGLARLAYFAHQGGAA